MLCGSGRLGAAQDGRGQGKRGVWGVLMKPGVVLQGRYEIVGALGAGGQGTVFEALDRRLGIRVAVKHSTESQEYLRQAFVREARLLASLRHPSLPVVSDHFVQPDGQFLVLELVPGEDLSTLLHRRDQPCALDEALTWADQLLDALEYLHAQSPPIIHRDIKPRNLRVRTDGRLMLLDFGIAKGRPIQDERSGPLASLPGYSQSYASLEQIRGTGTDARSDLYAVGATLYYLLTRHAPADATVREHRRTRSGDPLRPLTAHNPDVPPDVARAIHRAIELDPNARFQTATRDAAGVEPVREQARSIAAHLRARRERVSQPLGRRRSLAAAGGRRPADADPGTGRAPAPGAALVPDADAPEPIQPRRARHTTRSRRPTTTIPA